MKKTAEIEQLRKKLYVPLTRKDHLDSFSELGYSVRLGIYRSIESICDEIVA